jgi:hypothetical protein
MQTICICCENRNSTHGLGTRGLSSSLKVSVGREGVMAIDFIAKIECDEILNQMKNWRQGVNLTGREERELIHSLTSQDFLLHQDELEIAPFSLQS